MIKKIYEENKKIVIWTSIAVFSVLIGAVISSDLLANIASAFDSTAKGANMSGITVIYTGGIVRNTGFNLTGTSTVTWMSVSTGIVVRNLSGLNLWLTWTNTTTGSTWSHWYWYGYMSWYGYWYGYVRKFKMAWQKDYSYYLKKPYLMVSKAIADKYLGVYVANSLPKWSLAKLFNKSDLVKVRNDIVNGLTKGIKDIKANKYLKSSVKTSLIIKANKLIWLVNRDYNTLLKTK